MQRHKTIRIIRKKKKKKILDAIMKILDAMVTWYCAELS
jgi:hypothetical protein